MRRDRWLLSAHAAALGAEPELLDRAVNAMADRTRDVGVAIHDPGDGLLRNTGALRDVRHGHRAERDAGALRPCCGVVHVSPSAVADCVVRR